MLTFRHKYRQPVNNFKSYLRQDGRDVLTFQSSIYLSIYDNLCIICCEDDHQVHLAYSWV